MNILVTVCVALSVLAGPAAAADTHKKPGPEMERLMKALSGTWSVTVNLAPSERLP